MIHPEKTISQSTADTNYSDSLFLERNPTLQTLSSDFIQSITIISIFRGGALFATVYDDVYAFGNSNQTFRFGLGHKNDCDIPVRIPELSKIGVRLLQLSSANGVALTDEGNLYLWGSGTYGAGNDDMPHPVHVLKGKRIIDASYFLHALALSSDGKIYVWENVILSMLSNGSFTFEHYPARIKGLLATEKVEKIALSGLHYMALTASGKVFSWGLNHMGQLGDGTVITKYSPVQLHLQFIVQIACGAEHSLALDSNGRIFAWGSNRSGQIATSSSVKKCLRPCLIHYEHMRKATNIFAYHDASFAEIENRVWVWGEATQLMTMFVPKKTRFRKIAICNLYLSKEIPTLYTEQHKLMRIQQILYKILQNHCLFDVYFLK